MRLNRFLAAAGIASRRKCDELIAAGRVTINGQVCTDFSAQPNERDHVKVDGKLVQVERALTIALNKPAGFVSTRSDPHARNTVFDLLPSNFPRLFNIGRLDAQSEGLLLLTNDGDLAQRLTHPSYQAEKEYEVTLDRLWDSSLTPKLLRGIVLDGKRALISHLHPIGPTRLRVILRQGLNQQIRRMFYAVGYDVKHLVRVRVGNLRLADLPRGEWRIVSKAELADLERPIKTRPADARANKSSSPANRPRSRSDRNFSRRR
ncbi:MAG TPA: pseudouridine synthase [Chthoniobacterales bacterium]|nr:pseudouridine synthase [Chthoniobacterales bacterium]